MKTKKITATVESATCKIKAVISISGHKEALTVEERNEVSRKLKHNLTKALTDLPYQGLYPHEVHLQ